MMRTAETNMRETSDAIASELDQLIESASELLDTLNEQRSDVVEGLRERATRNIENARRRLGTLKPQVQERATQAAQAATGFARRNPWSAAAIGTVIVASVAAILYASMGED